MFSLIFIDENIENEVLCTALLSLSLLLLFSLLLYIHKYLIRSRQDPNLQIMDLYVFCVGSIVLYIILCNVVLFPTATPTMAYT